MRFTGQHPVLSAIAHLVLPGPTQLGPTQLGPKQLRRCATTLEVSVCSGGWLTEVGLLPSH